MERKLIRGQWVEHADSNWMPYIAQLGEADIKLRRLSQELAASKRQVERSRPRIGFLKQEKQMLRREQDERGGALGSREHTDRRPCCSEAMRFSKRIIPRFVMEGCDRCAEVREVEARVCVEDTRDKADEMMAGFKPWKSEMAQREISASEEKDPSPNYARLVAYPSRFGKTRM